LFDVGKQIEWERLRDFLRLAKKAARSDSYKDTGEGESSNRQTVEIFVRFLTSKSGLFLKEPLVHELAEAIDGLASIGEASLLRMSAGFIRPLPGGNGPVNERRMEEVRSVLQVVQTALAEAAEGKSGPQRLGAMIEFLREVVSLTQDAQRRGEAEPVLAEFANVAQMVAAEVLEIRGSRAIRSVLRVIPSVDAA